MKKLFAFVLCVLTTLTLSVPAFADLIALPPQPAETPNFLLPALLVLIVAVVIVALIIYKSKRKK